MQFVGIDIGSEHHALSLVDESGKTRVKPTMFAENADGYELLLGLLPPAQECLLAMEATGHYWQNLFAFLSVHGYGVALINPIRTHRFAEEELRRAKTDKSDALLIARFAAQKRPPATAVPEPLSATLRQLLHLRDRIVQDFTDRVRQLHRVVDLSCPELTSVLNDLGSSLSTGILSQYPTAERLRSVSEVQLSKLRYDGVRKVGLPLARELLHIAQRSVGAHQGEPYELEVLYICEDLSLWRQRIVQLDKDIAEVLRQHQVGTLLTSIDGLGPLSCARIIAAVGDPSSLRSPEALAAYVGPVPATSLSGKSRRKSFGISSLGNASLRKALWMPTLRAVTCNPWLKAFYDRLRAAGKPFKVALIASMRKLLHAVYSVAKNRRPFVPHLPIQEVQSRS